MKSVASWPSVDWTRLFFLPFLGIILYRMSAEVIHQVEEALDEVKKNSRHLAKRQCTWFRRKDNIDFIKIDRSNFNNTINQVTNIIKEWYYEK